MPAIGRSGQWGNCSARWFDQNDIPFFNLKNAEMTIKTVLEEIGITQHPVARALHSGHGFKVLVIGFAKGVKMKEHTAKVKAKITVLRGSVVYRQGEASVQLDEFDEHDIPVGKVHSVEALTESLCLLTQGD